jgi:hypothetical protein
VQLRVLRDLVKVILGWEAVEAGRGRRRQKDADLMQKTAAEA